MKEWIKKRKKHMETEELKILCANELTLIAEIEQLEEEREEVREDLNAKKRFWKGKYADTFEIQQTINMRSLEAENRRLESTLATYKAVVEKVEKIEIDKLIEMLEDLHNHIGPDVFDLDNPIIQLSQLQQALQAAKNKP